MTEVNAEPKEASKMDFFVSKSMMFVWVLHASLFYLFQKEVPYINFRKAYLGSCQTFTRSSRPEVCCKKGVIRNFVKFTGKHLCQSLSFLTKLQAQTCNFIKKETLAQLFSCEFCEISTNTFFTEHQLLLSCQTSIMELFCEL